MEQMPEPPCQCSRCRKLAELTARRDRARQILADGHGTLALTIMGETVLVERKEDLCTAIEYLDESIEIVEQSPCGARRRRSTRSMFMQR